VTTIHARVGGLLRQWRTRRRISQLDLSIAADVSTRHLSFVETGRSRPTPGMILRLAKQLDVPLRERNRLLLAGGYAPVYPEHDLDDPRWLRSVGRCAGCSPRTSPIRRSSSTGTGTWSRRTPR
jgi:transcriptional regulator with XRE-family HTH domain